MQSAELGVAGLGKFAVTFSSHSQSGIQGLCVKIKHKNKYVTPASKPEKR